MFSGNNELITANNYFCCSETKLTIVLKIKKINYINQCNLLVKLFTYISLFIVSQNAY